MNITLQPNGYYRLEFKYRPAVIDKIKELVDTGGRRYISDTKTWEVHSSRRTQLEQLVRAVQSFEPISWGRGVEPANKESDIAYQIAPIAELTVPHQLKINPYPYQSQGIAQGLQFKRFLNTDKPGLGKTLQGIGTIHLADAFPCLVICPSSLKINWEREWHRFTDKKATILSDSIRDSWPFFWKTGLNQVFIVNYESLKKYFVQRIKKSERWTLRDVEFRQEISLFRSVIIDESHRCFTYDTKILTNKGWLKIGDIVENKIQNLSAASWNFENKTITFERIINFWKNETGDRRIHRIKAGNIEIETTENHQIYVDKFGWKEAISIQRGEELFILRKEFFNEETWKVNSRILREKLRFKTNKFPTGSTCQNGQEQKQTACRQDMRRMRKRILRQESRKTELASSILFKKLFGKMENETTGGTGSQSFRKQEGKASNIGNKPNERPRFKKKTFRENEREQSHEESFVFGENDKINAREKICFKRWKREINRYAKNALGSVGLIRRIFGICNQNKKSETFIPFCCPSLQSGHSNRAFETGNRDRRSFAQDKKSKVFRSKENGDIECVRVESNTIFQRRNNGRLTECYRKNKFVYDLEVENNNNYFANGILVHNCKSSSTQQSKFCKGICAGKEWVLELTGTPVVNRPKDIIPQLSILNRLEDFGGYKHFVERYCSGPNEASNLAELNYKLRTICMFGREKEDVLKDLPEKIRQVLTCEINNRKEYQDAEKDLISYLQKYKEADDEKIAKAMRGEVMVHINILRQISARGKVKEVIEFVNDFRENGQKIILFCSLHEIVDGLKKAFPSAVSVTGRESSEQKQASVDAFQKNPKTDIIICSIKAAGVGLTLTAASNVAFVEFPWTYADCLQCEDRAHRIGQKSSVTCYYFLGRKTIDEKVYRIIQTKKNIANAVTGSVETIEESIVDMVANIFSEQDAEEE